MKNFSVLAIFVVLLTAACGAHPKSSEAQEAMDLTELPDWVSPEDRLSIKTLALAGAPNLETNAQHCSKEYPNYFGQGEADRALCMKHLLLPGEVFAEIRQGNAQRFVNLSDYDQRVTRLYAFEHGGLLSRELPEGDLEVLVKAFDIPVGVAPSLAMSPYIRTAGPETSDYLSPLTGLTIDGDWRKESASFEYALVVLEDAETTTYTWHAEVSLYPGGGFTTSFHLVLTDSHLLFIKIEGWNA